MASNPRWCQPLSIWKEYFIRWMEHPVPEHVLAASMYFDLRAVTGAAVLGETLRGVLREEAPKRRHFLSALAHDVSARRPPLSLLGGVSVERRGPHRGTVDVKGAGSLPLTGAARVWALDLGVEETNTIARMRAAGDGALVPVETATAAADAYAHLLHLRLDHQLAALAAGAEPDNRVAPARLSRQDAVLLREALHTVGEVQGYLRDRYRTELMG